jgi:large subunit ribosomal protein L19
MRRSALIEKLEATQLKDSIPYFQVGDTISVHLRIIEGEKERLQVFTGIVIARSGSGLSETVSMYRVAYGEGMERVFCLHSPRIAKIELVKEGVVRQAKLYYLRGAKGKAAKVKSPARSRRFKELAKLKSNGQKPVEEKAAAEAPTEGKREDLPESDKATAGATEE